MKGPTASPADRLAGDRPEREIADRTRTIVIGPYRTRERHRPSPRPAAAAVSARAPEARLEEAVGLALSIDLKVVSRHVVSMSTPRPATFLGSGKVEELAGIIAAEEVGLVVMDCALTPVQQRNLERAWGTKVIDRTGLILEIFGRRARTREGTLQVELAHLDYQKSRLVGPGPTSSASAAASASWAGRVKPRSRRTAARSRTG